MLIFAGLYVTNMDDFSLDDIFDFFSKVEEFKILIEKKQDIDHFSHSDLINILSWLVEEDISEEAYIKGLKRYPESIHIFYIYARYLILNRKCRKAKTILRFLKISESKDPYYYKLQTRLHLTELNFDKACRSFQKGLRYSSPEDIKSYLLGCGSKFIEHSETLAYGIKILERANSIKPINFSDLWLQLNAYFTNNQLNEAYELSEKLLNYSAFDSYYWLHKSKICLRLNKIEESFEALYYAHAIDPGFPLCSRLLAEQLYRFNRYEEAISIIESTSFTPSFESYFYSFLGECYYQQNNIKHARSNALKAIKDKQDNSGAWLLMAKISFYNKDSETAMSHLKKSLLSDKSNPMAWVFLSIIQKTKRLSPYAKLSMKQAISYYFEKFDSKHKGYSWLADFEYIYKSFPRFDSSPKGYSWLADFEYIYKSFRNDIAYQIYSQVRTFLHFSKSENSDKALLFFYIALIHLKANRDKLAEKYINLFLTTACHCQYPSPKSLVSICTEKHPEILKSNPINSLIENFINNHST